MKIPKQEIMCSWNRQDNCISNHHCCLFQDLLTVDLLTTWTVINNWTVGKVWTVINNWTVGKVWTVTNNWTVGKVWT